MSIEDSIDDAIRTTAAEAFTGWRTQLTESLRAHGAGEPEQLATLISFATLGLIVRNATSTVGFSRGRFPPPTGTRARYT